MRKSSGGVQVHERGDMRDKGPTDSERAVHDIGRRKVLSAWCVEYSVFGCPYTLTSNRRRLVRPPEGVLGERGCEREAAPTCIAKFN